MEGGHAGWKVSRREENGSAPTARLTCEEVGGVRDQREEEADAVRW